ncbi:tail fiber assembly protein [Pantoea sp. UBA6567]|uniref:tail fiber assembly protein n=1 Tax=Pantoea sp. UBA6567 TaxID=1947043 RepID=UPI0025943166|nr:tail fiber assembly protein [Pantoea sp. UBA6567]
MKDYVYSASLNMICALALKNDYEMAGTWPEDAVLLDDVLALEFMGAAPLGKVMSAGENSLPVWTDLPPLTAEEALAKAEQRKASLLSVAQETISIWQTKLLLGRISDAEKNSLNQWLDYIDAVQAIHTNILADIIWPSIPVTLEV